MAFVWVQDISPGAPANAAGLNEVQTNLDTIYAALGITRGGCASGAGWTEFPIAGGLVDPKLSSQPQQLRDATDYAYDNKCPAYDSGYQSGVDTTEDTAYESGYKSGVRTTEDSGYNSGYLSTGYGTHWPVYYVDQHGAYYDGHLSGVKSPYTYV